MGIEIRTERPGDENAIDTVNCNAFRSMNEANIVRLSRMYSPAFHRRYSVTAWDGGDMVGHTLLSPARIRLMGDTVDALALGPVAVVPERQRQGIGGRLLEYSHEIGRRDGFALCFLHGHPSYYPQHGYRACHGFGAVHIDPDTLPEPRQTLRAMPVQTEDVPWLVERQAAELADVDFGWLWGPTLNEWTIPCINAVMWWSEDGHRAAYTVAGEILLADSPELAREAIMTTRPTTLKHHPSGWLARNVLDVDWATCAVNASGAAMAMELERGVLDPYLKAVESGSRPTGSTLFPLPFLAC